MRLRHNPLPRRKIEYLYLSLLFGLFPITVVIEFIYILPCLWEPSSFEYIFTILMGLFLFVNTMANLMACIIVDTSVDPKYLKYLSDGNTEGLGWRHCKECDHVSPPKSRHCKTCGVCMLHYHHHCLLAGYCIGHQNRRYFIIYLSYLFAIGIYFIVLNSLLMLRKITKFENVMLVYMMPTSQNLISSIKSNLWKHVFVQVYFLNVTLVICSCAALIYHLHSVLCGGVCADLNRKLKWNIVDININLRSVLGKRMHIAWICPLIESQLPEDGYFWTPRKETEELPSSNG